MKRFLTIFVLLISLFAFNKQIKADTIHVTLSQFNYFGYCQDTLNLDTFIIHKPSWYGTTTWLLDIVPQGAGDSLIFIPTQIGSYQIVGLWNNITTSMVLNLFGDPPAHSTLSVTSGGYLNATSDTAWKCGNGGIQLHASMQSGLNITYKKWTNPNASQVSSTIINDSLPGLYVFEAGNTCGVTYDSVLVVELPVQLPVWNDTSFCNTPMSMTLDAGAGWDSYVWNTSETTQSILSDTLFVDTTVTYTVITSNICATDTTSIIVEQHNFPTPNLSQFNMATPFCADSVLMLNPSPGFTYDTYSWSWGTNGSSTDSTIYITGDTLTGSNVYTVNISMGFGCFASATDSFGFYPDPEAIQLCVVTVDTNGQILVAWDQDEVVTSYNIYRLVGINYQLVGNALYPATQWYDTVVNPTASAYRYKISAISANGCNDEGPMGYFHGSIHITNNPSTNGGQDLTITDPYIDESGNYVPPQSYVLIDSINNGSYTIIDSINANFNSFHIEAADVVTGATYAMGVLLPTGCTLVKISKANAKGSKATTISMSVSNKTSVMVGIQNHNKKNINLRIYPNPSGGVFQIESTIAINTIEVYNSMGQLILTTKSKDKIDLSTFEKGIYYATITTGKGVVNRKLIVK